MKLFEFLKEKYDNREDKDNIYGVGISDAEFRAFMIDYILGEGWYVVDPISQTQINEIALHKILEKCSKRYRKEHEAYQKGGQEMSKLLIGMSAKSGKFGVAPDPPENEFCCDAEKDNTLCESCKYFTEYHGIPMCEGIKYQEKEG